MNSAMVAEFIKINFKIEVEEKNISPGYLQDKKKTMPRQPVWKIEIPKDVTLFISFMKDKVVGDIDDFHPAKVGDGYSLPNNLGFVYISEITSENSKYSRGLKSGIKYYDMNTYIPGR